MSAVSPEAKEYSRKMQLQSYYDYKAFGICWHCKTRWAEPGRTYCKICTRQIKARKAQLDPGNEKRKAYDRERRARLKEAGICIACGKRKAREGIVRCNVCQKHANESRLAYRVRKRVEEGKV